MRTRKTWIVDRKLQHHLIKMILVFGVLITLISLGGLQLLSNQLFEMMRAEELTAPAHLLLMQELNRVTIGIVLLSALCLMISWIAGLLFSNQIAGPIFSITKTLDNYLEGDHKARIQIRKEDQFQELAQKINQLLDQKS